MASLFIILYPFMWEILHLDGYSKEVFALIFGFWFAKRKPVEVPYSIIHRATGATTPTISAAIQRLESAGWMRADHKRGQKTRYEVTLPDDILEAIEKQLKSLSTKNCEEVKPVKQNSFSEFSTSTKTSSAHNNTKGHSKRKDTVGPLYVPDSGEYKPSGLKTITTT